jgi:predicted Zn-dependent protease
MLGERAAAERILTDVLATQPTAEPALTMMVSGYVQANRLPEAADLLERARRADPTLTRVTASLGNIYIRSGLAQKALDLAASTAATSTEILGLRAAAHLALGQKQEAREAYGDILAQNPKLVGARRQLVALLIAVGDFESARNVVTAGIAAKPRDYQLYQDYVQIDLKSLGMDAALATADRLQAQDRDFPAISALKGDIYLAANRPGDAVTAYIEANDAAPSTLLITRLGVALLRAGRADEARTRLQTWLNQHENDLLATEQLAEIDITASRWDDAAGYLEVLLKQKPHDPVALNNLAWVYQQLGKDTQARTLARQAYVLSPSPQTADTLGWILTTSGDPKNGATLLRQATGDAAPDPRILYHFAVALNDCGDKQSAKKALETVVANHAQFREKGLAQKLLDDLSKGT